jgi:hypothetical protein
MTHEVNITVCSRQAGMPAPLLDEPIKLQWSNHTTRLPARAAMGARDQAVQKAEAEKTRLESDYRTPR